MHNHFRRIHSTASSTNLKMRKRGARLGLKDRSRAKGSVLETIFCYLARCRDEPKPSTRRRGSRRCHRHVGSVSGILDSDRTAGRLLDGKNETGNDVGFGTNEPYMLVPQKTAHFPCLSVDNGAIPTIRT